MEEALNLIDHRVKHILIEIKEPGYEKEILSAANEIKDMAIFIKCGVKPTPFKGGI
ncbi:MAG: hypothetical protein ACP5RT_02105 [Candidatus Micrarchaeia archaeon]